MLILSDRYAVCSVENIFFVFIHMLMLRICFGYYLNKILRNCLVEDIFTVWDFMSVCFKSIISGYLYRYLYPIVNCFMIGCDERDGILSIIG